MKLVNGLNELQVPLKASVLSIGNFDGVHLGHRRLLSQVVEKSRENQLPAVAMTFFPHPSKILRPQQATPRLFSIADLECELSALGIDVLVIEPFNRDFSLLSAEEFIGQRIVPALNPKEIVVGYDFAFGREREGSFEVLQGLANNFHFVLSKLNPVLDGTEIISSSMVRKLLAQGEVQRVASLLQRPFYLSGRVEKGEGRGESLGFPTANLRSDAEVFPAEGVYFTHFCIGTQKRPSLTNVGRKPTFHDSYELSIETHVLNIKQSFYGETAKIEFLDRLRPELKFPSARELINQIEQDVRAARKYFGS